MRFGHEEIQDEGALETHTLTSAFDKERPVVELVVFELDLAHLSLEFLVLETVLGRVALNGDGGRVGFGFGLDRLRGRFWWRHGGDSDRGGSVGGEIEANK